MKTRTIARVAAAFVAAGAIATMFQVTWRTEVRRRHEVEVRRKCYELRDAADRFTADQKRTPGAVEEIVGAGYLKGDEFPAECVSPVPGPTDVPVFQRRIGEVF